MTKLLMIFLALNLQTNTTLKNIYNFSKETKIEEWRTVNDDVMGGTSRSSLNLTDAGQGKFSGFVSLANNGGFASIQLNTSVSLTKELKFIVLNVKGDGKNYEFRLKSKLSQAESYVQPFKTSGNWEIIKLKISEFYPQYRGRKLNMANFNFDSIEQLSFLISNKKEENFELLIDSIGLE